MRRPHGVSGGKGLGRARHRFARRQNQKLSRAHLRSPVLCVSWNSSMMFLTGSTHSAVAVTRLTHLRKRQAFDAPRQPRAGVRLLAVLDCLLFDVCNPYGCPTVTISKAG